MKNALDGVLFNLDLCRSVTSPVSAVPDWKFGASQRKMLRQGQDSRQASGNAAGVGMGLLGIGIPDIPLLTGMMLRSIYETALHYGFSYDTEEEKRFILLLIQGAMAHGERLERVNDELNFFMEHGSFSQEEGMEELIRRTAGILSDELLYMKFLQGIPIAGVVGGAGDAVYMNRISEYARLKYHRRFCLERLKKEYNPSSHLN